MRLPTLAAGMAALALALTACGDDSGDGDGGGGSASSVVDKAKNDKKLVIGIKYDQPGLGLRSADGSFSGFDVEMAKYIAKELGVEESGIEWKETVSANREPFIQQGQVDMVLATYSITDARKEKVSFAGPYFVAGQSLLVRNDNTDITGPESLNNNKKLCSVSGSTPAKKIKEEYAENVQLQEFDSYSKCVDALIGGQVDAVTTDDIILAGFAAANPGKLKVVGKPFSTEKYGVGLKKDDKAGRDAVNAAIEKAFSDGAWKAAFDKAVGPSGYPAPATPPTLEKY
ncbi:MAG TPA: glutamate ABC transporter substrate-binding protein [Mycobacteriales bacterium]|nr:glutamate ABC transporter substrate-binding protein [Mycobacteriales bacterium]